MTKLRSTMTLTDDAVRRRWYSMVRRCNNPADPAYHLYGGRGIKVCDRWLAFENFKHDIGPPPTLSMTLDRVDNSKGYGPDNCRWATAEEQARNRRSNRLIEYHGALMTVGQICDITGSRISPEIVRGRVFSRGWSLEDALTTTSNCRRPPPRQ